MLKKDGRGPYPPGAYIVAELLSACDDSPLLFTLGSGLRVCCEVSEPKL